LSTDKTGNSVADGRTVEALVYIYRGSNLVDPATSVDEEAAMIRNARGTSASAIEYVRRNFKGLQAAGLRDPAVTELRDAILAHEWG
jgi:glutathione-specific gamma-glutamylcyclotransferase